MKKSYWFLLIFSATLYALPFLWNDALWWLIFTFPIPLLYVTRTQNLSFIHGYMWGLMVFLLHLSGGIYLVARLAGEWWMIGLVVGIGVVLYQALTPAIIFWCTTMMVRFFPAAPPLFRLSLWTGALALFILWTDQYCMWIFGVTEGYPLMHPLVPLMQQPCLLLLLPIVGKQWLTIIFLLVPSSIVLLLWYKNYWSLLLCVSTIIPWVLCYVIGLPEMRQPDWYCRVKSLPCMAHSMVDNPVVTIKIVAHQLKKIITTYPHTELIIMPESAFNVTNFAQLPELLQLWHSDVLGKPIHLIFGTCRRADGNYYNSLHWVYNGVLQNCFDKKHAMLMTERLAEWMNSDYMRKIYFKEGMSITRSCNDRITLAMLDTIFVPYICSELFFNELPDDSYGDVPIIAMVNDTLFLDSYIQELLLLLARFRAMQWQREIVYVSYGTSLFMGTGGMVAEINE